jgi:hypothetical protein
VIVRNYRRSRQDAPFQPSIFYYAFLSAKIYFLLAEVLFSRTLLRMPPDSSDQNLKSELLSDERALTMRIARLRTELTELNRELATVRAYMKSKGLTDTALERPDSRHNAAAVRVSHSEVLNLVAALVRENGAPMKLAAIHSALVTEPTSLPPAWGLPNLSVHLSPAYPKPKDELPVLARRRRKGERFEFDLAANWRDGDQLL